jgi:hypothetical protein
MTCRRSTVRARFHATSSNRTELPFSTDDARNFAQFSKRVASGRGAEQRPGGHMAAHAPFSSTVLIPCPICLGTGRNPETPAAIADDDGTCLVCCSPLHPWYAAWHGQVRVNVVVLADPANLARLAELAEA